MKIIDSGHQDSQYLATLTFDTTAGAAQDECPASPSPTVVGWMATRMAATPTTVARWMPVRIAVPLAAVGAREKVAPHCVTAPTPSQITWMFSLALRKRLEKRLAVPVLTMYFSILAVAVVAGSCVIPTFFTRSLKCAFTAGSVVIG